MNNSTPHSSGIVRNLLWSSALAKASLSNVLHNFFSYYFLLKATCVSNSNLGFGSKEFLLLALHIFPLWDTVNNNSVYISMNIEYSITQINWFADVWVASNGRTGTAVYSSSNLCKCLCAWCCTKSELTTIGFPILKNVW